MNDPIVDSTKIGEPRSSLPHDLFALFKHMQELGWDASIKSGGGIFGGDRGNVFFEKKGDWHGRNLLACSCNFGYHFEEHSDAAILYTARRAAELCLTVYETFGELLPSHPNVYGIITPDRIANKPGFIKKAEHTRMELRFYPGETSDGFAVVIRQRWVELPYNARTHLLQRIAFIEHCLNAEYALVI